MGELTRPFRPIDRSLTSLRLRLKIFDIRWGETVGLEVLASLNGVRGVVITASGRVVREVGAEASWNSRCREHVSRGTRGVRDLSDVGHWGGCGGRHGG